jgi:Tol biopolymer transport system component
LSIRALLTIAVLGLLTCAAFDSTPAADATFAGANGKVAFIRTVAGVDNVFIMNADGSGVTNLTNSLDNEFSPAWSPDGTRIAFSREVAGDWDIYVITGDGGAPTRLTNGSPDDTRPTWSPDGQTIAWRRGGEIWSMNADGSGAAHLIQMPDTSSDPDYSPDGTKIAFSSRSEGEDFDIWVANADGSDPQKLTDDPSPARAGLPVPQGGLPNSDADPSWSPDGSQIAFRRYTTEGREIWVMNSDGTGRTALTDNPAYDDAPDWSPDGTLIAFASDRDGQDEIFTMHPDGSNVTRLTNGGGYDPDWQAAHQPWGDVDCDGSVTTRDNQAELRFVLRQNALAQTEPCPDIGSQTEIDGAARLWGDVDCDGSVTTRDNQAELRFVLRQNALSQTEPCPDIGAAVEVIVPQ